MASHAATSADVNPPLPVSQPRCHTLSLRCVDLGTTAYAPCLDVQYRIHQEVVDRKSPPTVLLVEHRPVITLSQRRGVRDHLLVDERQLAAVGIALEETDRGGDITYHGPGQLVVYPILRLADHRLNVGRYIRLLEQAIVDALAGFGVDAHTQPGLTGVWISPRNNQYDCPNPTRPQKIAAIGVRVRRGVTLHGLALNVSPRMDHFNFIVPCGLHGHGVASMKILLGPRCPEVASVGPPLVAALGRLLETSASRPVPRTMTTPVNSCPTLRDTPCPSQA